MNEEVPKVFDSISQSLGVNFKPAPKEILVKPASPEVQQKKMDSDFEYARENLK